MTNLDVPTLTPEQYPNVDPHWVHDNIQLSEQKLAAIPPRFAGATITIPEVAEWAGHLVHQAGTNTNGTGVPTLTTGPSLLLLGTVGSGKTHNAYAALRSMAKSGVRCQWAIATAADVYAALRPRNGVDSEAEFHRYGNTRLLVLDDLGASRSSEWVEETNYRLINHRYEHELPTLLTSNLSPRDMTNTLGERVASRLAEMTTRVVLDGPDRRRQR